MTNKTAENIKIVGEGVAITGMAGLFTMSVVGTVVCDAMILLAAMKESENQSSNNSFITGYLFGTMTASRSNSLQYDAGVMLIASPFLSAIAAGLAVHYGYPSVAWGLFYGWSASASVTGLGVGIHALGECVEKNTNTSAEGTTYITYSETVQKAAVNGVASAPVATVVDLEQGFFKPVKANNGDYYNSIINNNNKI